MEVHALLLREDCHLDVTLVSMLPRKGGRKIYSSLAASKADRMECRRGGAM